MAEKVIKPNVYVEFQIILDSDRDKLEEEFKMIIGLGRIVILWSKFYSLVEMATKIIELNLQDYIWDYKQKDACYYSSIDFIIDNDKKLVDRFTRNGKKGNYVERIE